MKLGRGLALFVLLAAIAACVSAPPPTSRAMLELGEMPDPLSGPGVPQLNPGERQAVKEAFALIQSGHFVEARDRARPARSSAAGQLVAFQAAHGLGQNQLDLALDRLTRLHPRYAAAWVSLAVIASQRGLGKTAVDATTEAARLWPNGADWPAHLALLELQLPETHLRQAEALLADDLALDALMAVDRALELDPGATASWGLRSHVLRAIGRYSEAVDSARRSGDEELLGMAQARLAISQARYTEALQILEQVDPMHLGHDRLLDEARIGWRLANAPPWIAEAARSESINRGQLATLLVGLLPQLHPSLGTEVGLLSDVIELPYATDIVRAAGLRLISADRLEQAFHPERTATAAEARTALDGLARLLGAQPPGWCSDSLEQEGCILVTEPISGMHVLEQVLGFSEDGGDE